VWVQVQPMKDKGRIWPGSLLLVKHTNLLIKIVDMTKNAKLRRGQILQKNFVRNL
jgi:hypothetical protein